MSQANNHTYKLDKEEDQTVLISTHGEGPIKRSAQIQNLESSGEESGIISKQRIAHQSNDNVPMSYFLFKSCRMRRTTLTMLVTCFLVLALIAERFCFIVTVYKTRYYGYVLILIVILFNSIFNFVLSRL